MLILQTLPYIEEHSLTGRPIKTHATGILVPLKGPDAMLNWIALSNLTGEEWAPMQAEKQPEHGAPMQAEKQPEHGRALNTKEQ